MAKSNTSVQQTPVVQEQAVLPVVHNESPDALIRGNGGPLRITSITVKRTLTKPLVSVSHREDMVIRVDSEIYERELPLGGRSEKNAPAKLVDITELIPVGDGLYDQREQILVCNAMIVGAFTRDTQPLTGRFFLLHAGEIKGDKKYRHVDVQELGVTL